MLFREDPRGLIVVTQPAHAFVSGQLARAWGNALVGELDPCADVILAAEQHDLGWTDWEAEPTLNPRSGRPHTFMSLPLDEHLQLWAGAATRVAPQSRYAALLVSGHITGLYRRRASSSDTAEQARRVADFLVREEAFQCDLLAALRADPVAAPRASDQAVGRNQRLVAGWDRLSLALCGGLRESLTVENVPTASDVTALQLTPLDASSERVRVFPWPFATETVVLTFEGRRFPFTFLDQTEMRAALRRAPWVTLELRLVQSGEE